MLVGTMIEWGLPPKHRHIHYSDRRARKRRNEEIQEAYSVLQMATGQGLQLDNGIHRHIILLTEHCKHCHLAYALVLFNWMARKGFPS
ncbi:hypothetical protein BS78_K133300 [Paspalum vaginatum]|uniref:Uncharacterized protein n=1 Tax=Paspalum vaginatum TaxID=158149 RepID=A0A9W7X8K7_9POAL|nr:hypothetical protein BS78_K133300 [Paspalum vaginatum]